MNAIMKNMNTIINTFINNNIDLNIFKAKKALIDESLSELLYDYNSWRGHTWEWVIEDTLNDMVSEGTISDEMRYSYLKSCWWGKGENALFQFPTWKEVLGQFLKRFCF